MFLHSVFPSRQFSSEHFFTVTPAPGKSFLEEAENLLAEYGSAIAGSGCSEGSELLLRFHCSDIVNQAAPLKKLLASRHSFVSMIGQPPAEGSRIALEAWHILPMKKHFLSDHSVCCEFKNYRIIFFEGSDSNVAGSHDQTAREFAELESELKKNGASVAANTVRTWLYCRDVDNNYAGLVQARNQYFDAVGLTTKTHFIASTGIEGISAKPDRLVTMDSISVPELKPEQFQYLSAPEKLSPTAIYNVRFERGTRVIFGDRSQYYISGTASIDKYGDVLYQDDVRKQTRRALDNIQALLQAGGADLPDLKQATVYMRDIADASIIREEVEKRLPAGIPMVLLKAPVCRPAWLVEIEAIAINGSGGDFPPLT